MSANRTLHWDPIAIEPNRDELLRYLGYRNTKRTVQELPLVVEEALTDGWSHLHPRGIAAEYCVNPQNSDELLVNGITIHGQVSRFLNGTDKVVAFLVTVGNEVLQLAQQAMRNGDIVRGWALDALGSFAAEATAEAVSRQFETNSSVSPRYSPGYCGMELATQRALFDLLDAERIGVSLLPSMLMQPTKSVSGLLGLGPTGHFPKGSSPCERCAKTHCSMRR